VVVRRQICLDRLVGDRELVVLLVVSRQFRLVLLRRLLLLIPWTLA
jgi:hypothetical protein